jgi:aspartyl-tRNA(Asn)/glutamyl-tRNA(Gln) amidotransferase subunit C
MSSKKLVVTKGEVDKLAQLANLTVGDSVKSQLADDLSSILDYVGQLQKLDLGDINQTAEVTGQSNITHLDQTDECLTQKEAISQAVSSKDGYVEVPGIFADSQDE